MQVFAWFKALSLNAVCLKYCSNLGQRIHIAHTV